MSWLAHRRLVVVLTAAAGFVSGHAAAYIVVHPEASDRAAAMHTTGHEYWGAAIAIAVAAALGALAATGWRAARSFGVEVRPVPLAVGQVVLFAAAEAAERSVGGVPLTQLVEAPEFLVGVMAQVIVAVIAVWLLRRWSVLIESVLSRPHHGADILAPQTTLARSPVPGLLAGCVRTRAPPHITAA